MTSTNETETVQALRFSVGLSDGRYHFALSTGSAEIVPVVDGSDMAFVAMDYHGGQASALYAFASSYGLSHGYKGRTIATHPAESADMADWLAVAADVAADVAESLGEWSDMESMRDLQAFAEATAAAIREAFDIAE